MTVSAPVVSAGAATAPSAERAPRRAWLRRVLPYGGRWAAIILAVLVLAALLAPWISPYDPNAQPDIVALKNLPPSLAHPFGTDPFSRDVLSRVLFGARISLSVAALATAIAMTLGTAYGAIAGYVGGVLDTVLMRVVDALLAIPRVLLLIALVALWHTLPLWMLIVVLGTTGWFGLSRLVRAQVLAIRERDYVRAAEALGAPGWRVLVRHVLPNVLPTVIVAATLGIGQVILLEAGLSYLGLGVQPPTASWGNIIQDGADQVATLWWVSLFPGLLIVTTAIACTALGDALEAALDPHRRTRGGAA